MPQDAFQNHTIEDTTYMFAYLPPRQALSLWARLAKHLVPALAAAFPKKGNVMDADVADLNWSSAAGHITQLLATDQFDKDIDLLLSTVRTADGVQVTIDMFVGRIGTALKVAMKALEVNYSDFFAGFKSAVKGALTPKTESPV